MREKLRCCHEVYSLHYSSTPFLFRNLASLLDGVPIKPSGPAPPELVEEHTILLTFLPLPILHVLVLTFAQEPDALRLRARLRLSLRRCLRLLRCVFCARAILRCVIFSGLRAIGWPRAHASVYRMELRIMRARA